MTYPGVVAERLHPGFIADMSRRLPEGAIVVTGTNGKTTTSKMLGDTLGAARHRVIRNDSGSNLRQGIASTFVRGADLFGHLVDGDMAVLEVDEAAMAGVTADIGPRIICVTNLFRDQLDRYGELDATATLIGDAIASAPAAHVLLNADDPFVAGLARRARGAVSYFGVEHPGCVGSIGRRGQNAASCPACGGALVFSRIYYAHLGDWSCPECGLARPTLDFSAREVALSDGSSAFTFVTAHERARMALPLPGLHNVYNALAASACAAVAAVAPSTIATALACFRPAFGRMEVIAVDDHRVTLVLVKNPAGVEQSIASVLGRQGPKMLGIALNDNDADGTDVSWIWDVDFESFDLSECCAVLAGSRAEDIALRLKYAGLDRSRLRLFRDPAEAVALLASLAADRTEAHMFATYTAMLEIRNAFAAAGDPLAGLGTRLAS
jgi:UDP-N-acetylmuramyl tripeptide synthase